MIIKTYPTLYNQKANGLTQQWKIWVESLEDGTAEIYTEYGQFEGVQTKARKHIKLGKNIGRSNETNPLEQAISEADSTFQKKIDNKYVTNIDEVGANIGISSKIPDPMLAKSYDEYCEKLKYPCYVQPKLDGIRCIAKKMDGLITLYSRKGKPILFMEHIVKYLEIILEEGEMLDGELYSHTIDFQTITSIVRQQTEPHELIAEIKYHIYDYPTENTPFAERLKILQEKYEQYQNNLMDIDSIELVETQIVNDEEDIDAFHQQMRMVGYEGTMVRSTDGLYRFKYRSPDLLKYKDFVDEEFQITGIREDTGPNGDECIFECITAEGLSFNARSKGESDYRKKLIADKLNIIGKLLTVKFQEKTNDGVPRFPVGKVIRDYE